MKFFLCFQSRLYACILLYISLFILFFNFKNFFLGFLLLDLAVLINNRTIVHLLLFWRIFLLFSLATLEIRFFIINDWVFLWWGVIILLFFIGIFNRWLLLIFWLIFWSFRVLWSYFGRCVFFSLYWSRVIYSILTWSFLLFWRFNNIGRLIAN